MATANYLTHLKTGKYNSVLIEDLYHSMTQNASNWGLATGQRLKVWTSDDIIRLLTPSSGVSNRHYHSWSGPSLSLQDDTLTPKVINGLSMMANKDASLSATPYLPRFHY